MNCPLISSSHKSLEWVDKTPGQIRRTGPFVRWWFIPAGNFLSCQCFCLAGEAQGIWGDLWALCILHCDSPTVLHCRKRSQTCSAGTQEQSDSFCCLLCPIQGILGRGDGHCCLHFWVSTSVLWSLHPPWRAFGFGHRHPCDLLSSLEWGIVMFTICVAFQHPHNGKSAHLHFWKLTTQDYLEAKQKAYFSKYLCTCYLNWLSNANSSSYFGATRCRGYEFSSLLLMTYVLRQH